MITAESIIYEDGTFLHMEMKFDRRCRYYIKRELTVAKSHGHSLFMFFKARFLYSQPRFYFSRGRRGDCWTYESQNRALIHGQCERRYAQMDVYKLYIYFSLYIKVDDMSIDTHMCPAYMFRNDFRKMSVISIRCTLLMFHDQWSLVYATTTAHWRVIFV